MATITIPIRTAKSPPVVSALSSPYAKAGIASGTDARPNTTVTTVAARRPGRCHLAAATMQAPATTRCSSASATSAAVFHVSSCNAATTSADHPMPRRVMLGTLSAARRGPLWRGHRRVSSSPGTTVPDAPTAAGAGDGGDRHAPADTPGIRHVRIRRRRHRQRRR